MHRFTAKNEVLESASRKNPIWPPEYDLPGNFIFSLLHGGILVTPHHSDFYDWWMGNSTEINHFA